jgi:tetratricopeptide (TPR) repeat protein
MAESLAILGIASNIIQIIEIGMEVVDRIRDFSDATDTPKIFRDICIELPLWLQSLKLAQASAKGHNVSEGSRESLLQVIIGCRTQIKDLAEILSKNVPEDGDSSLRRTGKAIHTFFGQEKKITRITKTIREYMATLTNYQSTNLSYKALTDDIASKNENRESFYFVPSRHAREFVSRPAISSTIERIFSSRGDSQACTTVLLGMGGQGKTQLAMDFCRQQRGGKLFTHILWTDASSEQSVKGSFSEISRLITHHSRKFSDLDESVSYVKNTLCKWTDPWLMVLDNYDDPAAFVKNVLDYMPDGINGHFLITSRHRDAERLGTEGTVVEINGMENDEAEELLLRRAGSSKTPENKAQARHIVKRLGYHPLAIDQAGAYIKRRSKLPLHEFLDHFLAREKVILTTIHGTTPEYTRRLNRQEKETALSVFTSWELSFQQLDPESEDGKRKASVLTMFAFLQGDVVSERVFRAHHEIVKENPAEWVCSFLDHNGEWDHYAFEDVLLDLRDLSLILDCSEDDDDIYTVSLHPLVRDWIKLRLQAEEQQKSILEAVEMVHNLLMRHRSNVEGFDMSLRLKTETLSYVTVCEAHIATHAPNERIGGKNRQPFRLGGGQLVDSGEIFALFYQYMGLLQKAQDLLGVVVSSRTQQLQPTDLKLLASSSFLTEVFRQQRMFKEAEDLDKEIYEARIRTLGREHPDTLSSCHDLGWDLEALGNIFRAEELQRTAVEGRQKLLGINHPLTLQSINNLAHTLRRQGKTLEASELMKQTVDIGRIVFLKHHSHHPELLLFMANLADYLRFQGQLEDAEAFAREALLGNCLEWGESHLKTAASRGHLHQILLDQEEGAEAEKMAENNLMIMSESAYSTDLSLVYDNALLIDALKTRQAIDGINREATIESLIQKVLPRVSNLSEETFRIPTTLEHLAFLALTISPYSTDDVVKLEQRLYTTNKAVFGASHEGTMNSLFRLSKALHTLEKRDAAHEILQTHINLLEERANGSRTDPFDYLETLTWLCHIYKHLDDQEHVRVICNHQYYYYFSGDFSVENLREGTIYEGLYNIQGLAQDLMNLDEDEKAEKVFQRLLLERREIFGESPCVDDTLYAFAWLLKKQNRNLEALEFCNEALQMARKYRGLNLNTVQIERRLAYLYHSMGNYSEAEMFYQRALEDFRKLGPRHRTAVTTTLEDLQEVLVMQKKWVEAEKIIKEALARRREGRDKNKEHEAILLSKLSVVMWELDDDQRSAVQVYLAARAAYEEAWGVDDPKNSERRDDIVNKIDELLPGSRRIATIYTALNANPRDEELQYEGRVGSDDASIVRNTAENEFV